MRILDVCTWPFTRTPALFVMFVIMQAPLTVYFYWPPHRGWTLYENFYAYFMAYSESIAMTWQLLMVYCGLRCLKRRWPAVTWLVLVIVVLAVNMFADLCLKQIYNHPLEADLVSIFAATNPAEGSEFLSTYLTPRLIRWTVASAVWCLMGYYGTLWIVRWLLRRSTRRSWLACKIAAFVIVLVAEVTVIAAPADFGCTASLRGKMYEILQYRPDPPMQRQHPRLMAIDGAEPAPARIVVIVGESLSRLHCQTYGYAVANQPRLQQRVDSGQVVLYNDPVSPALTTLTALKQIIGTYTDGDTTPYYRCPTFIEVAQLCGYRVNWFSNQASKGASANAVTNMADLADHRRFTNNGMMGKFTKTLDNLLLAMADSVAAAAEPRQMDIYHLLGSHFAYEFRYPGEFAVFTPADYPDRPASQRFMVAAYDNSVLFNDYVVSSIMDVYSLQDAIVLYVPDHAEDIYMSSPDYAGHALPTAASSPYGHMIPMMVYMTPQFRQLHPELSARITEAARQPGANTTNLIYTLMDIIGVDFADSPGVVRRHSFARPRG